MCVCVCVGGGGAVYYKKTYKFFKRCKMTIIDQLLVDHILVC